MTKLSRSQGCRLRCTYLEKLLSIRVLVVALAQALVDLVQTLVALVYAHVNLVQALFLGKETGYCGARIWTGWICKVFERGVRRGQVCYSQVVEVSGVGGGGGEAEGWTSYIDSYNAPRAQHWGLMLTHLFKI